MLHQAGAVALIFNQVNTLGDAGLVKLSLVATMELDSLFHDLSSPSTEKADRAAAFAGNFGKFGQNLLPLLNKYCIERALTDTRFGEKNFAALISMARIIRDLDSLELSSPTVSECITTLMTLIESENVSLFHSAAHSLGLLGRIADRSLPLLVGLLGKYKSNGLAKLRIYQSINSISPESMNETMIAEFTLLRKAYGWE